MQKLQTRLCPPSPSAPEFLAPFLTQGDWLQSGELIPRLRCSTGDHRDTDPTSCIQRRAPYAPGPLTCACQGYGGGCAAAPAAAGPGWGPSHGCSCTLRGAGSGGRGLGSWARWAGLVVGRLPDTSSRPAGPHTSPPFSHPTWWAGASAAPPLPAEPAREKETQWHFFLGPASELKLSWDLSYTHTPFSKRERGSFSLGPAPGVEGEPHTEGSF